jgi:hypothetical protein
MYNNFFKKILVGCVFLYSLKITQLEMV